MTREVKLVSMNASVLAMTAFILSGCSDDIPPPPQYLSKYECEIRYGYDNCDSERRIVQGNSMLHYFPRYSAYTAHRTANPMLYSSPSISSSGKAATTSPSVSSVSRGGFGGTGASVGASS